MWAYLRLAKCAKNGFMWAYLGLAKSAKNGFLLIYAKQR